jgi:glycine dehydrogenase subunit 1
VTQVLKALSERHILGGYHLSRAYPERDDCVLVCATETKSVQALTTYARALSQVLQVRGVA